jgi:integrase
VNAVPFRGSFSLHGSVSAMPRLNKPWYRKDRKSWYVTIDGRRHCLGKTKKEADQAFYDLMSDRKEASPASSDLSPLLEDFLESVQTSNPKSYDWYVRFISSFVRSYPHLKIDDLKPHHVETWARGTSTRGKITAMKRAMNWAVEMGHIKYSPIAKMKRPKVGTRKDILTDEEFAKLMTLIPDKQFRDLIQFSWECGARPQESKLIEARHIDFDNSQVFIPEDDIGKHGLERRIYLNETALKIIKENLRENGPLFLNTRGKPWTRSAVKCRFDRLTEKFGRRLCQYTFRHSWVTRMLKAGMDSHVVAALAGHKDTTMIDRVYSKVASDHAFLLDQVQKVSK